VKNILTNDQVSTIQSQIQALTALQSGSIPTGDILRKCTAPLDRVFPAPQPAKYPLAVFAGIPTKTGGLSSSSSSTSSTLPALPIPDQPVGYDDLGLLKNLRSRLLARARDQAKYITFNLQKEALSTGTMEPGFRQLQLPNPVAGLAAKVYRGTAAARMKMLKMGRWQESIRDSVEHEQLGSLTMTDAAYRKSQNALVKFKSQMERDIDLRMKKDNERQARDALAGHKTWRERKTGLWDAIRKRNLNVQKLHEKFSKELLKEESIARMRRMEALKAKDMETYQRLIGHQRGGKGDERYREIETFLSDTEQYLHRLATRLAQVRVHEEASEAARAAGAEARAQGKSQTEVNDAARAAAQRVAAQSVEMSRHIGAHAGNATDRFIKMAHSVTENVTQQPKLLHPPSGASMRDYQIVGLQWMVSLYNNHLNGILADEMGLGKTVQVMALLAYLMEHKSNYGPHLIIVPNAVLVNWKGELQQWLPTVRCVYYAGTKTARQAMYRKDVQDIRFNVLVTTYEVIMKDRAVLAKIDWKYIVIDEAQRMRDRSSKLSRDLDKFRAARRLLLTGTPLQNDLKELWALLNP